MGLSSDIKKKIEEERRKEEERQRQEAARLASEDLWNRKKSTQMEVITCDIVQFWRTNWWDVDFTTKLYREGFRYSEFEIREQDPHEKYTRVSVGKSQIPSLAARELPSDFHFIEEGKLEPGPIWRFKRIPSAMADKIAYEGRILAERAGEHAMRLTVEYAAEAKLQHGSRLETQWSADWREGLGFIREWFLSHKGT